MTNRSLVILSGETSSVPEAEARALFLAYDPNSEFETPEERIMLVKSEADPSVVGSRIAFARRVGRLISDPSEVSDVVKGRKIRLRVHTLSKEGASVDPHEVLGSVQAEVDLANPDFEFTLVSGRQRYLALSAPGRMRQGWSVRRPRRRPFFHPSAIFPKLSRALVNLSRCKDGDVFVDPFAGTGSLALEAGLVGARVVAADISERMTGGSLDNMKGFGQEWLGVIRCDSLRSPVRKADAVATDVPYGRASSTRGRGAAEVIRGALETLPELLPRGARMVVMHPKDFRISESSELGLEEEHDLYVHKRLTRTITVLRRR